MNSISDPAIAAQNAQMIERLSNLSSDMQELKTMMATVIGTQRDVAHLDEKVRRLFDLADNRGPEIARLDKRLSNLERWQKIAATIAVSFFGVFGWSLNHIVGQIQLLDRMDSRVNTLELIVNGHNIEKAMEVPKISGSK